MTQCRVAKRGLVASPGYSQGRFISGGCEAVTMDGSKGIPTTCGEWQRERGRFGTPLTQRFGGTSDYRAVSIPCRKQHVPLLMACKIDAQMHRPPKALLVS
jgi:hypothetical protein